MTITSIAAWWGAVVSTAVFIWDIVKWLNRGAKLRVNISPNVTYPDAERISTRTDEQGCTYGQLANYYHIEIANVGAQPTTILSIEATHLHSLPNGPQISCSGPCFRFHNGASLPHKLGPGESVGARLDSRMVDQLMSQGAPILILRAAHSAKPLKVRMPG
jgi:hypothetical protein